MKRRKRDMSGIKYIFPRGAVKAPILAIAPPSLVFKIMLEMHARDVKKLEIPMTMKGKINHV